MSKLFKVFAVFGVLVLVLGMAGSAFAQAAATVEVLEVSPTDNMVTVRVSNLPAGQYAVVMSDSAVADGDQWQVATVSVQADNETLLHRFNVPTELQDASSIQIRYVATDADAEAADVTASFNPGEEMLAEEDEFVEEDVEIFDEEASVFEEEVADTGEEAEETGEETGEEQIAPTGIAAEYAARRFISREQLERVNLDARDYSQFDAEQQGRSGCGDEWIIRSGEYLGMIVINCDVPLDNLLAANPQITNPDVVWPGEAIRIPDVSFGEIFDPESGDPFVSAFPSGEDSQNNNSE